MEDIAEIKIFIDVIDLGYLLENNHLREFELVAVCDDFVAVCDDYDPGKIKLIMRGKPVIIGEFIPSWWLFEDFEEELAEAVATVQEKLDESRAVDAKIRASGLTIDQITRYLNRKSNK